MMIDDISVGMLKSLRMCDNHAHNSSFACIGRISCSSVKKSDSSLKLTTLNFC